VRSLLLNWVLGLFLITGTAIASDRIPPCLDGSASLPIDNEQAIEWRNNTPNQFERRAHIEGRVSQVFNERSSHSHFEIQIGANQNDVIEVIYNKVFGKLATPYVGMTVEACGDYITSFARAGSYPPSPSGAIIHWVHYNYRNDGHKDGYLVLEGDLYGDQEPREQNSRGNQRRRGNQFYFPSFSLDALFN